MAYNRYQYETSPRKLKPEYEQIKHSYPKKSTARKQTKNQKSKPKAKNLNKVKVIFEVAIVFASLFVISYRYSVIDRTYSDLKHLRLDLATINKETAQLEANIESSLNLGKIEEDAKNLLGMKKLTSEQIVYVTLPKSDYVETSSEEITSNESNSNWFMEIINKIIKTLVNG